MSSPDTAAGNSAHAAHVAAMLRTARRVFLGSLTYTAALTVFWAVLMVVRPERAPFFQSYGIDRDALIGVFGYFTFFVLVWGFLWYGIRLLLLRKFVKMSKEDAREVFSSRMSRQFHLPQLRERYSERRIRVTDMIGRRGRFITMAILLFSGVYVNVAKDQDPKHFTAWMTNSLFGTIAQNWLTLAFFYSDGVLARAVFGPQARIMDGVLGRANCLVISTLWSAFAFVMVPISTVLAANFPPHTLAAAFVFIWPSYVAADALSEIVGSLFGKQKLQVWGIGEVNKKSVEGAVAGFVGSLAICLVAVYFHNLTAPWIALAVVVSLSNTLLELFSPRGTDDFTMATANALLCAGFGALYY